PDARIGVVVNDFGELNIDAGLVVGQVDEPFSISGGCICCLSDDSSLEDALVAMTDPSLRLDAIIVEASGFAEPLTLARMVTRMGHHRFHLGGVIDVVDAPMHFHTVDTSDLPPPRHGAAARGEPVGAAQPLTLARPVPRMGHHRFHLGGVIDVVDAPMHFHTVDTSDLPPLRYAATTLVLVNKLDQLPAGERETAVEAVRDRVHQRNPRVIVIGTHHARLDPALIFDPGAGERDHRRRGAGEPDAEPIQPELPIRELLRQAYAEAAGDQS